MAKSFKCADISLDALKTLPTEVGIQVTDMTAQDVTVRADCEAAILLPESQRDFDYATKITRKHGRIMTILAMLFS